MRWFACLCLALIFGGCSRRFAECRHCADFLILGILTSTACPGNRVLTTHGAGSTTTSIYNPFTNTYSTGPAMPHPLSTGSIAFQIPNFGPRACQNVLTQGNNTGNAYYYNPRTNQVSHFTSPTPFFNGAHVIRYRSGISTRFLLIPGGSTTTYIYKPDSDTFVNGPNLSISTGNGVLSFQPTTGPLSGKFVIANGGGGANWRTFDPDAETISAHSTSALGTNSDSSAAPITSGAKNGQFFIAVGGANPNNMTYNPAVNTFGTVGAVSVTQGAGANTFVPDSGGFQGQVMIVIGNGSSNVDRYNPASDSVSASGLSVSAPVSAGGHNFLITAGAETGNRMIVLANGSFVNIFRPASSSFVSVGGLQLTATAGAGSLSVPIAD